MEQPLSDREQELVTRRGVSLSPHDDQIAKELAEKHHGGNISRLVRHLLQDAWQREQAEQEAKAA